MFIASKGQPIIYNSKVVKMIDRVPLSSNHEVPLLIEFISTNSKWRQGIVLQTNGSFDINGRKFPEKIIFWEHTAPKIIELKINSKDHILLIYNAWETEDGTVHYWHNGGALHVEKISDCLVYHCNDGYADDDFDDLIFKVNFQ